MRFREGNLPIFTPPPKFQDLCTEDIKLIYFTHRLTCCHDAFAKLNRHLDTVGQKLLKIVGEIITMSAFTLKTAYCNLGGAKRVYPARLGVLHGGHRGQGEPYPGRHFQVAQNRVKCKNYGKLNLLSYMQVQLIHKPERILVSLCQLFVMDSVCLFVCFLFCFVFFVLFCFCLFVCLFFPNCACHFLSCKFQGVNDHQPFAKICQEGT